jgi:hypothetical protein
MKEPIDFRGQKTTNCLPAQNLTVTGIQFKPVLKPVNGKASAYFYCREHGTSLTFFRPYLESFNEQAFTIDFPNLKASNLPDLIVKPSEIATGKDESLADYVVANRSYVIICRKGNAVEFILRFEGKEHKVKKSLGSRITPTNKLGDFITLR